MIRLLAASILCVTLARAAPVPVIFDTDMGNDVDGVGRPRRAPQSAGPGSLRNSRRDRRQSSSARGARLSNASTLSRAHPKIPVGVIDKGPTPEEGLFLNLAKSDKSSAYPDAVSFFAKPPRRTAGQLRIVIHPDRLLHEPRAPLLDSPPDGFSDLTGVELAPCKKVRLLSVMAGAFQPIDGDANYREYNINHDIESAKTVATRWPSVRLWSGFEIGKAVPYPHDVIERQFKKGDPLRDAYYLFNPPPHDRPNWDATAVLAALMPNDAFFHYSPKEL